MRESFKNISFDRIHMRIKNGIEITMIIIRNKINHHIHKYTNGVTCNIYKKKEIMFILIKIFKINDVMYVN